MTVSRGRSLLPLIFLCLAGCLALVPVMGAIAAYLFLDGRSVVFGPASPPQLASGTLRLFGGDPETLDPALVEDAVSADYVVEIFGGLVALDEQLQIVPDLAERWQLSPDGRTYTFFLREDTKFHDGRSVRASDFKFSMERACNPRTGSRVAAVYLGDIVGALEMLSGTAQDIQGIQVVNDQELRITIDQPKAYFLAKLTYSTAFVLDPANVSQGNWQQQPNGTGPFRLAELSSERLVLERNPHYNSGPPQLDRVVYLLSGGSPMSMYENGELDIVSVGPADVERVRDPDNPLHHELAVVPQLDVQYLGFDVTRPPFDDVRFRQAFLMAVDRQKLCEGLWKGMCTAAEGIVPPGMPGFVREQPLLRFDPERARELLAESRYADPNTRPTITLSVSGDDGQLPPAIRALVAMYRDYLAVEILVEQSDDPFADGPQMYLLGWIADYPDPEDFLDILFHSSSNLNRMAYSNPQVDGLLERARVETMVDERMKLYAQAEALIVADAPWVPLWHNVSYVLTKPYVRGAVYSSAIFPWLRNISIIN